MATLKRGPSFKEDRLSQRDWQFVEVLVYGLEEFARRHNGVPTQLYEHCMAWLPVTEEDKPIVSARWLRDRIDALRKNPPPLLDKDSPPTSDEVGKENESERFARWEARSRLAEVKKELEFLARYAGEVDPARPRKLLAEEEQLTRSLARPIPRK